MTGAQYLRLPLDLRLRPQWLLASPNDAGELKVPTSVSTTGALYPGSHSDAKTWLEFDHAFDAAQEFGLGLGYVLSESDPFSCVDFDVKTERNAPGKPELWTTQEQVNRMQMIAEDLDSYAEVSQSGLGLHVWCTGKIGQGIKTKGVEVYSQQRFIVCTGNVWINKPINGDPKELLALAENMRSAMQERGRVLPEGDEEITDEEVMRRAVEADNSAKFKQLWDGDWNAMGYPSQSEADLSLMSMLTFYSRNNEQCRRLFRRSKLGDREKALKDDRYLDYTLRLIRTRQQREDAAVEAIKQQGDAFIAERYGSGETDAMAAAAVAILTAQYGGAQAPSPAVGAATLPPATDSGLPWPPGFAGEIAGFIYNSSPRPIREVSIVAALGFLAGVCGKAWIIPGSGLNLYLLLIARSGTGKEALATGLSALIHRIRNGVPSAGSFVNFGDFASGPALAKACAQHSSFVNVSAEFGRKLQTISTNMGPMQSLRTLMTALYQKSGPVSIVGGINYSNQESNVAAVSGVAFSMIGESTPDTLYASLTDSMMEDGFLSRFNVIEYSGKRPPLNHNPQLVPSNELTERLQAMSVQALTLIQNHQHCYINRDQEAAVLMDSFDKECDDQINSSEDESYRQMWNRAHLKVMRVAALLAVADNYTKPMITRLHTEWALDMIRRDMALMQRRILSGDVGVNDSSRERKLLYLIHEYISKPVPESYGVPETMKRENVVPRKYLQMRVYNINLFSAHAMGAKRALDDALMSCCDSGYLAEIDKAKATELYTYQGRCFRIVQLPRFK